MSFIYFNDVEFTLITDAKGKPWLIAKELCEYLGLKNVATACKKIPACNKQYMVFDDLKTTGTGTGRGGDNGKRLIVNEPGAYQLVFQSNKPDAWILQQWLYNDVMPALNATGEYKMQPKIEEPKPETKEIEIGRRQHVEDFNLPVTYFEALEDLYHSEKEKIAEIQARHKAEKERDIAKRTALVSQQKAQKYQDKALICDQIVAITGKDYTLRSTAKMLHQPPQAFNEFLRSPAVKILYYESEVNLPMARYVAKGWFNVKTVIVDEDTETRNYLQTRVTPRGVAALRHLFNTKWKHFNLWGDDWRIKLLK